MITIRTLLRKEIEQVWNIDRSEVIDNIYRFESGTLVLSPHHIDVPGWAPGKAEEDTPILFDCFDRGGWFLGAFDGAALVGVGVLGEQAYRQANRSTPAQVPSREQVIPK